MRTLLKLILIGLAVLLLISTPVLAASVINALFIGDVVATNSGTATTNVCTVCPINTQALIDGKFATADLLNTALQAPGGTDIAYMPGVGTNPWCLFIPSIGASEQKSYLLYTGGPAMQNHHFYFPGSGGMAVTDSSSLELGDSFKIELKGWVSTSAGSDKNLVYKLSAFRLYISADGTITAEITGGASVSATGVSSGEHTIKITADGVDLKIYVNSIEKGSSSLGAVGVPDTANNWAFLENDAMLYMDYLKVWVSD